ncbi:bcl-2-modifying factor isoform X2 [Sus scrofa]|uniref:bcl-2-modifying factor isoform X2 n=1 Tax=Sus scrofa TaxID=9823 RepID=UPI000A2B1C2C|nr:bcl-2-modifying factor isoform X2 [Sus scrofa]
MPRAGVFWKQYREVLSGLLLRPPARCCRRPCPRLSPPATTRWAFPSFPIEFGRQAPECSSRWTLARSPGITTRRPRLSPGVTQAMLATGSLSLPVSPQACPLANSPPKGSGNIEQRYRLPENFSALQTSSIGFICSSTSRTKIVCGGKSSCFYTTSLCMEMRTGMGQVPGEAGLPSSHGAPRKDIGKD